MRDQIDHRDLDFARPELVRDLALIGQAIGSAFRTLTRIQFDAPWNARRDDCSQGV